MKANKKLLISLIAIILCAAIVVTVCVVLFAGGGNNSDGHIQIEDPVTQVTEGQLKVSLVREKLETVTLDTRGYPQKSVDETRKDFSDTKDNIFGIQGDMLVGPGCWFTSHMQVSNSKRGNFEYWIEIVPVGGDTLLADQIEITVEADGVQVVKQTLHDGLTTKTLAVVQNGSTSKFTATLKYMDVEDNDKTKNTTLAFDMTVHARLT